MKNIVIAIDSFKGSLSSMQSGQIARQSALEVFPGAEVKVYPLADGGEGTVDALTSGLGGKIVQVEVTGPLGDKINSRYGYVADKQLAIMEMADAAGLTLIPEDRRNPLYTTTFGLGELILHAVQVGCRKFIIGIGGSATNDCGLGMLTALGARFLDKDNNPVGVFGKDLANIVSVDLSGLNGLLKDCSFNIACDVTNPLCGENGCSHVFGPQKGATPEIVAKMDSDIDRFADLVEKSLGLVGKDIAGAGAAGGLGYAFYTFLQGKLELGIKLVLDLLNIKEDLTKADILITGEGKMDGQTIMGKAPIGVASLAKKVNPAIKTIAVCGCATPEAISVNGHGIDAYFPILHMPMSVAEAMEEDTAKRNLAQTVVQALCLLR